MAWHEVQYRCGHAGREQIYGPTKSRGWIAEKRGEKLCEACWEAQCEAERAQENAAAAQWARENGLPALVGTEKQIPYAEATRFRLIEAMGPLDTLSEEMLRIVGHASAAWWLDRGAEAHRTSIAETMARAMMASAPPAFLPPTVADALDAEATIQPDRAVTDLVAVIRVPTPQVVRITFPDRLEAVRTTLKGLGYTWRSGGWELDMTVFQGVLADRVMEAGHQLLMRGIPVRITETAWRSGAISGAYTPRVTRWIARREEHLVVQWGRDEDYYRAALALPSARWVPHEGLVVHPDAWQEVQDFAARYDFHLSPGAQALMASAEAAFRHRLHAVIETPSRMATPLIGRPDLGVPEEVTVDADFRDDH